MGINEEKKQRVKAWSNLVMLKSKALNDFSFLEMHLRYSIKRIFRKKYRT